MTVLSGSSEILWPMGGLVAAIHNTVPTITTTTLDAANERCAMIGYLHIEGRPTTSKTISSGGGGSIGWRSGSRTFSDAGTNFRVGIIDVDAATGAPYRPSSTTLDVYGDLTGGGGGIGNNAWNTTDMTSGTKTMSHGDLIAIVFDMTARAGSDSVPVTGLTIAAQRLTCSTVSNVSGSYAAVNIIPNAIITFDDGTLGWIDGAVIFETFNSRAYSSSGTPDEYACVFTPNVDMVIDAIWFHTRLLTANTSTATLRLYSDPAGTPSALETFTLDPEQVTSNTGNQIVVVPLATTRTLTGGTRYAVGLYASSTGNVYANELVVASASHLASYPGGTAVVKGTRSNEAGAFTEDAKAVIRGGVRVIEFPGSGGGGPLVGGRLAR